MTAQREQQEQIQQLSNDNVENFAAASAERTYRSEQIEVKVARVEEKIDALRERFSETSDALLTLIKDHSEADAKALAAQLEQNRLLQENIDKVDDFRKKLQYGAIGILAVLGAVWAVIKVALFTFTGKGA